MNIPCPSAVICPGTDSPFGNLSSEQPDQDIYIGLNWGWGWNFPLLGSEWSRNSCLGVCTSTTSQAEADLCAAIQNLQCLVDTWGPPGDGPGPISGPPVLMPSTERVIYASQEQICLLNCPDGTPFLYAVPAGIIYALSQEQANQIAYYLACRRGALEILCISDLQNAACENEEYSASITASRGPVTFSIVDGSLPPGITGEQHSGTQYFLDGTPTTPGNYQFTLRAERATGAYMQKTFTIHVLGITPTTLPDGNTSDFYNQTFTPIGFVGDVSYSIYSGSLPAGLTLLSTGNLIGTPNETGDFTFEIKSTDSGATTCVREFTLHIEAGQCPNWDDMVWTAGDDFGVITSKSFVGGSFSHRIDMPAGNNAAVRDEVGTLNYTGNGCNCQVAVSWDRTNLTETGGTGFQILQGSTVLVQFRTADYPALAGSTVIPFSLAPGVGANQTITVRGIDTFGGAQRYYSNVFQSISTLHSQRSAVISNV